MADVFLLTEAERKYFTKLYNSFFKALEKEHIEPDLTRLKMTEEQLQRVVKKLPYSPANAIRKWENATGRPYFMLMVLETYKPAPYKPKNEPLASNEFFLNGITGEKTRYMTTTKWNYLRGDKLDTLFKSPLINPIAEDSPAYTLINGNRDTMDTSEETMTAIRDALELTAEYLYIPFGLFTALTAIIGLCKEYLKLPQTPSPSQTRQLAIPNLEGFYNVPDGSATDLIFGLMIAGEDIDSFGDSKKRFNHSQKITVAQKGKNRLVTLESSKASVAVAVTDIEKLTKSNKTAKKLFVLTLIKANEQALHDGQLSRDYVCFPLQELVDIGFYRSLNSARTGFNSGSDTITSFKVRGHIERNKKNSIKHTTDTSKLDALEVLFTGARIEDNQCYVFLNPRINWSFIAEYFTMLPRYYFKLPNRASDLLYYIFYLARQHAKPEYIEHKKDPHTGEIKTVLSFNISFRAIQNRLHLPDEKGLNNPQRDIKDAILKDAIEPIEDEHHAMYNNEEFHLTPYCDETLPASAFLDTGYLKVELTGAYASTFIEFCENTTKQIEKRQKQRERIAEKARAINLAKKMEQDGDSTHKADK